MNCLRVHHTFITIYLPFFRPLTSLRGWSDSVGLDWVWPGARLLWSRSSRDPLPRNLRRNKKRLTAFQGVILCNTGMGICSLLVRSFSHFAQIKWGAERFAQITQDKWATVSKSLRLLKSLIKNERMSYLLRAGNSLIWFLSESLVFCQKMSQWAIHSKKWAIHSFAHFRWAKWAIRSQSLISSERPEQIAHVCSFLVSEMSNSLTLLNWYEQNEWFTHIAHR